MQEVKVIARSPVLSFALSGEIDSKNADEFFDIVLAAYEENKGDVLFDCSGLSFIDSTTLGTFVKILKHVRSDGHGMKLTGMQARLKKLFVICALDTIMEIE